MSRQITSKSIFTTTFLATCFYAGLSIAKPVPFKTDINFDADVIASKAGPSSAATDLTDELVGSSSSTSHSTPSSAPSSTPQCVHAFAERLQREDYKAVQHDWATFMSEQATFMESVSDMPTTSIHAKGVEFQVTDISDQPYRFLVHALSLDATVASKLMHYIEHGFCDDVNFDICPLLSTSVVDSYTGGFTSSTVGTENQVTIHLVLDIDPRAAVLGGYGDVYSPQHGEIKAFLKGDLIDGQTPDDYFYSYFSKSIPKTPQDLLKNTIGKFNEVIVMGNSEAKRVGTENPIRVVGIAMTDEAINLMQATRNIDNVLALQDLVSATGLPLMRYAPKHLGELQAMIVGKGMIKDFKRILIGKGTQLSQGLAALTHTPKTLDEIKSRKKISTKFGKNVPGLRGFITVDMDILKACDADWMADDYEALLSLHHQTINAIAAIDLNDHDARQAINANLYELCSAVVAFNARMIKYFEDVQNRKGSDFDISLSSGDYSVGELVEDLRDCQNADSKKLDRILNPIY